MTHPGHEWADAINADHYHDFQNYAQDTKPEPPSPMELREDEWATGWTFPAGTIPDWERE